MTNSQLKSHQIFHIARKTLSSGDLQAVFGRSVRFMQMWAADPRHCEVTRRNPLDRMAAFLDALDDQGRSDVVRAGLEYMIGRLPFRLSSAGTACSDKGTVDGEIADLTRSLGHLATIIETCRSDGQFETDELIAIKRAAMELKRGVDELLDAAGIKGGV